MLLETIAIFPLILIFGLTLNPKISKTTYFHQTYVKIGAAGEQTIFHHPSTFTDPTRFSGAYRTRAPRWAACASCRPWRGRCGRGWRWRTSSDRCVRNGCRTSRTKPPRWRRCPAEGWSTWRGWCPIWGTRARTACTSTSMLLRKVSVGAK